MEQETAGLVRRMAEGDSQAFDRLMEFYYPKILRMAYLISGSPVSYTHLDVYKRQLQYVSSFFSFGKPPELYVLLVFRVVSMVLL